MLRRLPQPKPRQCGSCSLCCKLIAVEELDKPMGTWCRHFKAGKGCTIHDTRPDVCRAWDCLWVQVRMPKELSPRATRCVAYHRADGTIVIEQDAPGVAERNLAGPIRELLRNGLAVEVGYHGKGMRYEGQAL